MPKRVCYIHVGPHKTGTSAIQWFLKENRAELLKLGYLVPNSRTPDGAHRPLARKLCGQTLPDHLQSATAEFVRLLHHAPSRAVIISTEALDGLLRKTHYARAFFSRIRELELEPKLVLFPRNQSQSINSRYAQMLGGFSLSEPFERFAQGEAQRPTLSYSPVLQMADNYNLELIARPFTTATIVGGAVPAFLQAIGIDPALFHGTNVSRNQTVGPFTVSVARRVSHAMADAGKKIRWRRQAVRCKRELRTYLQKQGLADTGYCGLTTALAAQIEAAYRPGNDAFARQVWRRSWEEIFAGEVGREFVPNDFDMRKPDASTERLLSRAVRDMTAIAQEIMLDPTLAVDAPWNDLRSRAGCTRTRTQSVSAEVRTPDVDLV